MAFALACLGIIGKVIAGAKTLAGSRQYDDMDMVVIIGAPDGVFQFTGQVIVNGIEDLRAVQCDAADATVLFKENLCHTIPPASARSANVNVNVIGPAVLAKQNRGDIPRKSEGWPATHEKQPGRTTVQEDPMSVAVTAKERDSDALVVSQVYDGILRLTLNNPPANALSMALLEALKASLDKAGEDHHVRVVIIAAAGKLFSAGHDLKELTSHRQDEDRGRAFFEKTMRLCAEVMMTITNLPKPVIAEIDGVATAAGCQLVATCDLAICTDTSTFGTPGVNIGLFCSTPMVALSRTAHRKQAMEMLLTGEQVDASSAREYGLVNRIVPKEYLRTVTDKYAAVIASKSPLTLKIGKEAFYQQLERPLLEAYDYTAWVMTENMMARDAEEGINAFLEKRDPKWTGR